MPSASLSSPCPGRLLAIRNLFQECGALHLYLREGVSQMLISCSMGLRVDIAGSRGQSDCSSSPTGWQINMSGTPSSNYPQGWRTRPCRNTRIVAMFSRGFTCYRDTADFHSTDRSQRLSFFSSHMRCRISFRHMCDSTISVGHGTVCDGDRCDGAGDVRLQGLHVQGQGVPSALKNLCWGHVAYHVRWRRAVGARHAASAATSSAALTTVA